MKYASLILMLVFLLATHAFGIVYIEQGGIYLYYTPGEDAIIARLSQELGAMISFLENKGLTVTKPLHIILDDKLDSPRVDVHMIPHREIRIPLRAPGVLEDGYLETDPWSYFMFQGLCRQGMYAMRSGIPKAGHKVFGEVISPNIIVPPWFEDGICHMLYRQYRADGVLDPFEQALFQTSVAPDLDKVSNHPGAWPGYYTYRIYGRPFLAWVYETYGWERIYDFLWRHGRGIIPIEIDLKAHKAFGTYWTGMWEDFRGEMLPRNNAENSLVISGYWSNPLIYWNSAGIYPGIEKTRIRSRYGYVDENEILWISEYDERGETRVIGYGKGLSYPFEMGHVWDPGIGGVAITRDGHTPYLLLVPEKRASLFGTTRKTDEHTIERIPAPEGVLQLSGPVRNSRGEVAVAANMSGNWDIWIYDGSWRRLTRAPSVEMDPWWLGETLVFSSNISGLFQICDSNMIPLTDCKDTAVLPRQDRFLCLRRDGWHIEPLALDSSVEEFVEAEVQVDPEPEDIVIGAQNYSPLKSIMPNYLVPDIFIGTTDVQLGVSTRSRDVTGDFTTNAGARYSIDLDYLSARAGVKLKDVGAQISRYPVSYDPLWALATEESRHECKVFWLPFSLSWMELSLNRLGYEPLDEHGDNEYELWGAVQLQKRIEHLNFWGIFESYSGGRKSAYGGFSLLFGKEIYSTFHVQAGKTWNEYEFGHGSYRIGGDIGEGYFTRRPSRLFPLRGFDSNLLEAGQALTSGFQVYWPLANIQKGYKTLPLFFHRLRLGTFIDAGVCRDHIAKDDVVLGAGIELITSMEIAWGNLSSFKMGIAWPIRQPDYLDETGPVFILQLGRPL